MRATLLLALGITAALWACDDDGELPPAGANPGASVNGALCQSPHVCKGTVCLSFDGYSREGYCSEACAGECHYGGDCLTSSEFDGARCLLPCDTRADCEGNAYCQTLTDARHCVSEDTCEETGQTYCVLQY
ncbi:hypothetical protein KKF91_07360 [Myxococcota bacterium]|nr:hypothetical protein [Myxococcota bacterium]MBU1430370.1 hypothetical protein [Myxococcota bacterium]MBU1898360.1 hypothetical protein [Myxococcota bacterium]